MIVRIVFALLLMLVPAVAFAHPGHVGPSAITPAPLTPDLSTAGLIALGLGVVAWLAMIVTIVYLRLQQRRATDRLVRARLYLGRAIEERDYWHAVRDFWLAIRDRLRP